MSELSLEWWQVVVGLVGVLGLSPAPWILGLAVGRIQFTKTADAARDRELAEKDRHYGLLAVEKDRAYSELKESRDGYKEATRIERDRADKSTDQLADVAGTLDVVVRMLTALDDAAAPKDGKR